MKNLPDRNSNADIIGMTEDPKIVILCNDPKSIHKYIICEIDAPSLAGKAYQIACAIREARDLGFEQGRKYIRNALGIEE
jgi:hypothetical protein